MRCIVVQSVTKAFLSCVIALLIATFAACGGSGSASSGGSNLSLSGTAASGAALAGATVDVKCSSGSTSTTTNADGSYSLTVSGGVLPCMVRATSSDTITVYHALVDASAGTTSAVVNVTPVTELIMAQAVGASSTPSAVFMSNSAPPASAVTNLPISITTVAASLKTATGGSVDFSSYNPMTTAFKAATSSVAGDSMDAQIDALMNVLKGANQSVSDISNTLIASSSGSQAALTNALAPLPSLCPYAHSGTYQFVGQKGGYTTIAINVTAKTVTVSDNSWGGTGGSSETNPFSWTSEVKCQGVISMTPSNEISGKFFSFSKGGVIVAAAGSAVNEPVSVQNGLSLGFPIQKIPLTSIPSTFTMVEYDTPASTGSTFPATFWGVYKLDSSGNLSCIQNSIPDICNAITGLLTANTDGTFNLKITNTKTSSTWNDKLFVYRAPDGQIMLAGVIANNGGMVIGTVQTPLVAPISTSTVNTWEVRSSPAALSTFQTTVSTYSYLQTPIDSTSYKRSLFTHNGVSDNWVDTFIINTPATGFRKRPALTYNNVAAADSFVLPLPGNFGAFIDGKGTATASTYFGLGVTVP
jgi:hypothetical protein